MVPMNSLGAMMVVFTTGSYTVRTLPSGQSDGLVTTMESSAPPSRITR
ncbi:Uncharacterised protein [Mycobacterium tuberculosis]|nr:Uncharacterised protein [Mycobacterium tuberculosis]